MPALHPPAPPLTDGVVVVRALSDTDVPAIVAACQDPEIPRYTEVPEPYGELEARTFLAQLPARAASGEQLSLAVAEPDGRGGALLGTIGVARIDWVHARGEVGYWLGAPARGRGAARRAVELLAGWAFAEVGLHRLEILVEPSNVASQRVAEAAGFAREGVLRSYRESKGRRRDYVVFGRVAAG